MPNFNQLPTTSNVDPADILPISQAGRTVAVSVGSLQAGLQPEIVLPRNMLLGRTSLGPGGPEPITIGSGLTLSSGTLSASGTAAAATPPATPSSLGGVVVGPGLAISTGGVLTPDPGVVALRSSLGAAAALNVGAMAGTVAAGDDPRIVAAMPAGVATSTFAPLSSPALTGTPTAPTPPLVSNGPAVATTAFVNAAVLSGTSTLTNAVTGKLSAASNLADVHDAAAARSNLGIGLATPTAAGLVLPGSGLTIGGDGKLNATASGLLIGTASGTAADGAVVAANSVAIATKAPLTDSRFYGVERTEPRAKYLAFFDGTSHPLAAIGLAAAQARYPNIGLTGATNLNTFETDTAAILQAEYDLRTGAGGIIGLPDGAKVMVSQQLWLQYAAKVWLHGGRGVDFLCAAAAGAAGVPVIRLTGQPSNAGSVSRFVPLRDIRLLGINQEMFVAPVLADNSTPRAGAPFSGFPAGSVAIGMDTLTFATLERVGINGFDRGTSFGANTWSIVFEDCQVCANNHGVDWAQEATGQNSGENMRFVRGSLSNNNIGLAVDYTVADGGIQGGSWSVEGTSIDYNVVSQVSLVGSQAAAQGSNNGFQIVNSFIETTGQMSGANPRISATGHLALIGNNFIESDGTNPNWFVQIGDVGDYTAQGNFFNVSRNDVGIFGTATSVPQRNVSGFGNAIQAYPYRPVLLRDGLGQMIEPNPALPGFYRTGGAGAGTISVQTMDQELWIDYNTAGQIAQVVLPNTTTAPIRIGSKMTVREAKSGGFTFVADAGVTIYTEPGGGTYTGEGAFAEVFWYAPNQYGVRGVNSLRIGAAAGTAADAGAVAATYAPLASPALTGTPSAPTAAAGTNTTQVATTAFVAAATAGTGTVPVSRTYTAPGAIAPTDALALINSASAVTMTLAAGSVDGFLVRVKSYGAGAVTISANIDGAAQSVTLNSGTGLKPYIGLRWNTALATYLAE